MSAKPTKVGLLNRAVLWHLQLCLRLLDRLGYQMTAVNVSAAIEALTAEALTEEEMSKMDLNDGGRERLILEFYEKHGKTNSIDVDSLGKGPVRNGNIEEN